MFCLHNNTNNHYIFFQRPLEQGADISYYSMTKYMNGHTDVIMGSVALNDSGLAERLRFLQNATGAVPSPFDCYLINRRYEIFLNILLTGFWITTKLPKLAILKPCLFSV